MGGGVPVPEDISDNAGDTASGLFSCPGTPMHYSLSDLSPVSHRRPAGRQKPVLFSGGETPLADEGPGRDRIDTYRSQPTQHIAAEMDLPLHTSHHQVSCNNINNNNNHMIGSNSSRASTSCSSKTGCNDTRNLLSCSTSQIGCGNPSGGCLTHRLNSCCDSCSSSPNSSGSLASCDSSYALYEEEPEEEFFSDIRLESDLYGDLLTFTASLNGLEQPSLAYGLHN